MFRLGRESVGLARVTVLLITSPLCWLSGVWLLLLALRYGHTRVFTTQADELALMEIIHKYKVTRREREREQGRVRGLSVV